MDLLHKRQKTGTTTDKIEPLSIQVVVQKNLQGIRTSFLPNPYYQLRKKYIEDFTKHLDAELAQSYESAMFYTHFFGNSDCYEERMNALIQYFQPELTQLRPSKLVLLDPRDIVQHELNPFVEQRKDEEEQTNEIQERLKAIFQSKSEDRRHACRHCRSTNLIPLASYQKSRGDEGQTYPFLCKDCNKKSEFKG